MKLSHDNIFKLLLTAIGGILIWTGNMIRDDIKVVKMDVAGVKTQIATMTQVGGHDFIADLIAEKDTLTEGERKLLEYILETSE